MFEGSWRQRGDFCKESAANREGSESRRHRAEQCNGVGCGDAVFGANIAVVLFTAVSPIPPSGGDLDRFQRHWPNRERLTTVRERGERRDRRVEPDEVWSLAKYVVLREVGEDRGVVESLSRNFCSKRRQEPS